MYTERQTCRVCGAADLKQVVSLGEQYVVDFVAEKNEELLKAPLVLVKCGSCHLVQLQHSVNPDRLYRKFWYRSGINEQMKAALRDVVSSAQAIGELQPKESVLDIGSNDGTMLSMYPSNVTTVGIDPCRDLVQEAVNENRQDISICGYFSAKAVEKMAPYKVITAIAMFYDLEDPGKFLRECKAVLAKDGLLVIQMNYLKSMLEECAFDNISHEHLTYFSLTTLKKLVEANGLEIVGANTNSVNGGSLRVYIMHQGKDIQSYRISADHRASLYGKVQALLYQEMQAGLDTDAPYERFSVRLKETVSLIQQFLAQALVDGKNCYLYGASTRGTVLTQALGLTELTVQGVAERDIKKLGLRMVGTWIPIMGEVECREKANIFVVLPWHFWEGIEKRERQWLEAGGVFLIPLPDPRVVTSEGSYSLRVQNVVGDGVTVQ